MLPYTAILAPQFVPAAAAGFLQDDDVLIGVAHGNVAKGFPAADLAQHGSVNDQMPDGPIEVTWCGVCNTGAVFRAKIENLVEPDPAGIYKTGEVFYETPMHVHRYLRNASHTEPARVLVFQAGDTGKAAPLIKLLMEEAFEKAANQEVSLQRLTLPAGTLAQARAQSGPGIVYVLEGKVEASGAADGAKTYNCGELFIEPGKQAGLSFRNASDREPARVLVYQVSEKR
jgi:quercetin dioxygenase-like cupin family protein